MAFGAASMGSPQPGFSGNFKQRIVQSGVFAKTAFLKSSTMSFAKTVHLRFVESNCLKRWRPHSLGLCCYRMLRHLSVSLKGQKNQRKKERKNKAGFVCMSLASSRFTSSNLYVHSSSLLDHFHLLSQFQNAHLCGCSS